MGKRRVRGRIAESSRTFKQRRRQARNRRQQQRRVQQAVEASSRDQRRAITAWNASAPAERHTGSGRPAEVIAARGPKILEATDKLVVWCHKNGFQTIVFPGGTSSFVRTLFRHRWKRLFPKAPEPRYFSLGRLIPHFEAQPQANQKIIEELGRRGSDLVKPGRGKAVILDDTAATGDTLLKAKKLLEAMGIRNPKAAVLNVSVLTKTSEAGTLAPGAVDFAAAPRGLPVLPGLQRKELLANVQALRAGPIPWLGRYQHESQRLAYRQLLRLLGVEPRKQSKPISEG